jgi:DNA repair protein RadD
MELQNGFPEPRAFQDAAHERLRDGVRNGHRCQMLMAATGAGKTYLGLRIINEALERGRRAIFVCGFVGGRRQRPPTKP